MRNTAFYILFILFFSLGSPSGYTQEKEALVYKSLQDSLVDNDNLIDENRIYFQEDFQSQYQGKDYNYTTQSPKRNAILERISEYLNRFFRFLFKDRFTGFAGADSLYFWLKLIFYLLLFAGVIIIAYKLTKNKYSPWVLDKSGSGTLGLGISQADLEHGDYQEIINRYKAEKNYRKAIRYYFIWLLKTYNDKEIISFEANKTSEDYLQAIADLSHQENFRYANYIYENVWYGEFEIQEEQFLKFEQHFKKAIHS